MRRLPAAAVSTIAVSLILILTVIALSGIAVPSVSAQAQDAETDAVKAYATNLSTDMVDATAQFLETTQAYYDLIASHGFDYEAAWAQDAEPITALIRTMRDQWLQSSNDYESNEGIVAGVPSLSHFDVLLDAGPSAADAPDEALDWTLTLPNGTELHSPGNIFHYLTEPALFATDPNYVGLEVDLNGDGVITQTEGLADANILLGSVQRLHAESVNLAAAIDAWEPTLEDKFTALLVMIPTMSGYFEEWKDSAFVAGTLSTEKSFVATSRLFDVTHILSGLDLAYDNVSPLVVEQNAALDAQINAGFDDLVGYVNGLYEDEQTGDIFDLEEADLLGSVAQDKAEALAALVAQAANAINVTVELN